MEEAKEYLEHLRANLNDRKRALLAYLDSKIGAADFHAVQDAASDIREIDASLNTLRLIEADALKEPA